MPRELESISISSPPPSLRASHRIRVERRVDVAVGGLPDGERGARAARLAHGVYLHVHARLLGARHVERCRAHGDG